MINNLFLNYNEIYKFYAKFCSLSIFDVYYLITCRFNYVFNDSWNWLSSKKNFVNEKKKIVGRTIKNQVFIAIVGSSLRIMRIFSPYQLFISL